MDAVPHLEFWVTVPGRISESVERCVAVVKHKLGRSTPPQRYEEVETMAYDGPYDDDL